VERELNSVGLSDETNVVIVDKFCIVKISVVIVESTKRDEYTTDDTF
jgi:hypothetical protein